MKVGIMQPYFFPYIGYFQLINAVDKFILYEDVNYKKNGWINRNNILIDGKSVLFSVPLKGISQNKKINEVFMLNEISWKKKILTTIYQNYKKAPFCDSVYPLIDQIIHFEANTISEFNYNQIKLICHYLQLSTEISSSILCKNQALKGQERILDICKKEKANEYVNPIGGINLYDKNLFLQEGLKLNFLKSEEVKYTQFNNTFVPNLSIIDILMFNSRKDVNVMLDEYELV